LVTERRRASAETIPFEGRLKNRILGSVGQTTRAASTFSLTAR
jgi:hypothetical protein